MAKLAAILPGAFAALALIFGPLSIHAQTKQESPVASSALPDVAGIRPGMPAQEAYAILKARNPRITMGVGQTLVPGFGDKPIVTEMRALVGDPSAAETLTVWLTIPPGKQVVLAVGRLLEYDPNQPLLRSKVLESLREKYGPETDSSLTIVYWAFDGHGRRAEAAPLKQLNCMSRAPVILEASAPPAATYEVGTSSLVYPIASATPCDSFIRVSAYLTPKESGQDQTYVRRILVTVWDLRLHRQTQEAYQAYLAHGDTEKNKEELEKAKQRKVPKF